MLYDREITDYVLIQYIILYTLDSVKKPIGYDMLLNLVLENCNIPYTDFQIALTNLLDTEHVRTFESENKPMYEIEPKGSQANGFFSKEIPIYIKEPIYNSIKPMFREEMLKNRIQAHITPVRKDEFSADLGIYDDDGTAMLELSFYSGTREQASQIAEYFSKNADTIYGEIVKLIVPNN